MASPAPQTAASSSSSSSSVTPEAVGHPPAAAVHALPTVAGGHASSYQSIDSLAGQGGTLRKQVEQDVAGSVVKGAQINSADLFGVTIKVLGASDLMVADLFSRSSDPYVKLTIDGVERKSKIIKKNLNPQWDETFTWIFPTRPQKLRMEVFDWDAVGRHDSLGFKIMDLETMGINSGMTYEGDVRLEGPGVKKGMIHVYIESLPIPNVVGRATAEMSGVKSVEDIVSLVELKIVGAEQLGAASKGHASHVFKLKNDPFATVSFGLHSFKTAMIPDTNNPSWNQLCPLWITQSDNNANAYIKISVWDYERLGKAVLIGNAYLRPSKLKLNHLYDLKLPLTKDDAETDAQLSVLMQDLSKTHQTSSANLEAAEVCQAPQGENGAVTATTSPASGENPPHHPSAPSPTNIGNGLIHLHFTLKPREQVEREFYTHLIEDYDTDNSLSMSLTEITHALTTIGVKLTPDEIEQAFEQADTEKTGGLKEAGLARLFRTPIFERKAILRHLYTVILYGSEALDSLLMKGCLTGSNTNMLPDDQDPTVDNEGVRIMVQDRESGLVVSENIPAYIKSALVLLNRTWMGKLASSKIKGTIKKLTIRQGKKMNHPKSKHDIPNFVKIHRLNLNEIELPLSEYKTFNEFFYRKLKPGVRQCYAEGDNSIAVSPADCRMMCFRSIEESQRLWIKGKHFSVGNLFGGWDQDGKLASKFNGGELCIARLAPQDYHRFHYPVSGRLGRRYLIEGDYNTVSPIAVRKEVDVYTDNKRCIVPIETQDFGLVVFIAIAATMVGSIGFACTCDVKPVDQYCCADGRCQIGREVKKFEDAGWFAFGGSTTLVLFQPGTIQFDSDLLKNSENQLETLVKVGSSLGKSTGKFSPAAAAK